MGFGIGCGGLLLHLETEGTGPTGFLLTMVRLVHSLSTAPTHLGAGLGLQRRRPCASIAAVIRIPGNEQCLIDQRAS